MDEHGRGQASPRRVLFISHSHNDKELADVLREFAEAATAGRVDVFQSSSAQGAGARIGRPLKEELKRALRDATVVVFLHTREDEDWSTCMWEVGVATDPDSPDTKVLVLDCGERLPAVLGSDVRVCLRKPRDVHRFVNDLLTSADFFPTFSEPVTGFPPDSPQVERAVHDLFKRLQAVLPVVDEEPDHSWCPYPYMKLRLTFDQMKTIEDALPATRLGHTMQLLENNVLVVEGDADAGRVYGVQGAPQMIQLRKLITAWREKTPTPDSRWIEGLACQVMDGALGHFPTLRWELMRGADTNDGTWYGPAVVRIWNVPRRRVIEFDVSLCKFSLSEEGDVEVGLPTPEATSG